MYFKFFNLRCPPEEQTTLSMNAWQVGREDELVSEVVHDLQHAKDEEVGHVSGLGTRVVVDADWKWRKVKFRSFLDFTIYFAHFTKNVYQILKETSTEHITDLDRLNLAIYKFPSDNLFLRLDQFLFLS